MTAGDTATRSLLVSLNCEHYSERLSVIIVVPPRTTR